LDRLVAHPRQCWRGPIRTRPTRESIAPATTPANTRHRAVSRQTDNRACFVVRISCTWLEATVLRSLHVLPSLAQRIKLGWDYSPTTQICQGSTPGRADSIQVQQKFLARLPIEGINQRHPRDRLSNRRGARVAARAWDRVAARRCSSQHIAAAVCCTVYYRLPRCPCGLRHPAPQALQVPRRSESRHYMAPVTGANSTHEHL